MRGNDRLGLGSFAVFAPLRDKKCEGSIANKVTGPWFILPNELEMFSGSAPGTPNRVLKPFLHFSANYLFVS